MAEVNRNMDRAKQASESMELGIVLALSGGMMDAYSYVMRDKVFANGQTGNIILFSINVAERNFSTAFNYFCPIVAFIIGIILAEIARRTVGKRLHWRQAAVIIEAVILFLVAFIPTELNLFANSLISLVCGIQVESFRKIHGRALATTMCLGNLRSGTQNIYEFVRYRDKEKLTNSIIYYGVIFFFIIGAVLGNFAVKMFETKAILFSSVLLVVSFIIMFDDRENRNKK